MLQVIVPALNSVKMDFSPFSKANQVTQGSEKNGLWLLQYTLSHSGYEVTSIINSRLIVNVNYLKGLGYPKMTILLSFTHYHVVSNLSKVEPNLLCSTLEHIF